MYGLKGTYIDVERTGDDVVLGCETDDERKLRAPKKREPVSARDDDQEQSSKAYLAVDDESASASANNQMTDRGPKEGRDKSARGSHTQTSSADTAQVRGKRIDERQTYRLAYTCAAWVAVTSEPIGAGGNQGSHPGQPRH